MKGIKKGSDSKREKKRDEKMTKKAKGRGRSARCTRYVWRAPPSGEEITLEAWGTDRQTESKRLLHTIQLVGSCILAPVSSLRTPSPRIIPSLFGVAYFHALIPWAPTFLHPFWPFRPLGMLWTTAPSPLLFLMRSPLAGLQYTSPSLQ